MKRSLYSLAAVAAFIVVSLLSIVPAFAATVTGRLDLGAKNMYSSDSIGDVFYRDHLIPQGSLTVTHEPSGVYVQLWTSMSLDRGRNFGKETDFTVGITRKVGGFVFGGGYSYWALVGVDLHDLFASVDFPSVLGATPYLCVDQALPTDADVLEGGVLYKAGLKGTVDVAGQPFALDAHLGGHDGAFGKNPAHPAIGKVGVSTTIGVIGNLSVTPSVAYQFPISGDCGNEVFYGANLSFPFDIVK
ncbi:MAG: hypothetical protein HGA38_04505 [Candidatus Moranbacteria bacterium]|nr:hypothetical protein [Candidatus Moranbacteria bacterium]NTW45916.1 hypothetical protein [Candidatus Moranbacteria bacterium]